jgi:hypothetical protein
MTVSILKTPGILEYGKWYNISSPEIIFNFPILNLENKSVMLIKVYSKDGSATPTGTVEFLSSTNTLLGTVTIRDYDTGSTANDGMSIVSIPAGSAKFNPVLNKAAWLYAQPAQFA